MLNRVKDAATLSLGYVESAVTFVGLGGVFRHSPENKDEIQFSETPFNPADAAHCKAVQQKIDYLEECYGEVVKSDVKIGTPLAADAVMWFWGSYGFVPAAIIAGLVYMYESKTEELTHRAKYFAEFQQTLEQLLLVYQGSLKEHGFKVTANETMIKLLKTISPFVYRQQLLFKDMPAWNPAQCSEAFKEILSSSLHEIPRSILNTPESASAEKADAQATSNTLPGKAMRFFRSPAVQLVPKTAKNLKRAVYGLDPDTHTSSMKKRA